MNRSKTLTYGLYACLLAWGTQAIYLWSDIQRTPSRIVVAESNERQNMLLAHRAAIRNLESDFAAKKYQATGMTVYDRIFNSQEQSVSDLIQRLADEALPQDWTASVKVEEFVHFILLVSLPPSRLTPSIDSIIRTVHPVIEHAEWALSNVAIFDHRHKSYLFFDKDALAHIRIHSALTPEMLALAKRRGESFTRFNSTTVEGDMHNSHLILPLEASGPNGIVVVRALLDTGAAITMLSESIIRETGGEDLARAPRRTFRTVNGMITCPIVTRQINIGGVVKTIEVAVDQRDELNLVGMNFFQGMDYLIDSAKVAVHMWEK